MHPRLNCSVVFALLLVASAGCRSVLRAPQANGDGAKAEPKVKYDAQWWSDRADENSVQSILERRKAALAQHAEQTAETLEEQPTSAILQPATEPAETRGQTPDGNDGGAAGSNVSLRDSLSVNAPPPMIRSTTSLDATSYGDSQHSKASWEEPPPLPGELPDTADRTTDESNRLRNQTDLPDPIDRVQRARGPDAIRVRAIAEDARGESIAVLAFTDGESVRVRVNDRVDVVSDGVIVEMRVAKIGAAAVYLEREDNKEVRIVR